MKMLLSRATVVSVHCEKEKKPKSLFRKIQSDHDLIKGKVQSALAPHLDKIKSDMRATVDCVAEKTAKVTEIGQGVSGSRQERVSKLHDTLKDFVTAECETARDLFVTVVGEHGDEAQE
jgi:pentose-5-phosphate-3-epimerase